ncbi:MAG: hypothetical protein F6K40_07220 [Okeania sp. SIO3I5]|uniref:hypothetical protein n=1 Tax=Okeania sp. SIO3I5 TaxID=2607805 RepID=UPI0013BB513F|nr:hypothetical protein [Okeania sp. SIO3I5]NEQ36083.1 hypothetical protein [Okeania sp. SIO3I5]
MRFMSRQRNVPTSRLLTPTLTKILFEQTLIIDVIFDSRVLVKKRSLFALK